MLFPWTVGARDLIPERLAEIIELQYKYVYLFNASVYANRDFKSLAKGTNQSSELV